MRLFMLSKTKWRDEMIFGGGISMIAAAIIAKRMGGEGVPWGRSSEIGCGDSILSSKENHNWRCWPIPSTHLI
jgi:hypothetical protein